MWFIADYYRLGITEDFLHSIQLPNIPPHILKLKVGMEGFLLRNLSPDDKLLNNTKIRVLAISRNLLTVELLVDGSTALIPRVSFSLDLPKNRFRSQRKQFPIRAGYCKTYNRSQGDTLVRCGLDIRDPPFEHGQLYVGTSRSKTRQGIQILCSFDQLDDKSMALCKNIVHQELLL